MLIIGTFVFKLRSNLRSLASAAYSLGWLFLSVQSRIAMSHVICFMTDIGATL